MKQINKKVLLVIFFLLLAIILMAGAFKICAVQTAAGGCETVPKIVIDPGHGGADGGAVGIDGLHEKDVNLEVSLKLRDILILNGYDVIMTRNEDCSIHDNGINGLKAQKTSDMHNRLKIMKENPDAVFVSIHQNKFEEESSWGTQVFYSQNNKESQQLAQIIQDNTICFIQPENHRKIKQAENNLFLLYNAEIPAVMIECGFISNRAECAKLQTEDYQNQLSYVIFYSINEFLKLCSQPSTAV